MEFPANAAKRRDKNEDGKNLAWWQLSLIGVGCIIGTGHFVGSGIGIRMTGSGILLAFILAAIGAYTVFDALGKMSAQDPQKGAFRTYAKKAFGSWAGFCIGWVYWFSEMLITGSQLTAISLLSRFWFPDIPLWVFSAIYAVLGILVIIFGTNGFEKAQNVFAVIKVSAIFMFIILAITVLFGFFGGDVKDFQMPTNSQDIFPKGFYGLWSALIFGFYAFGGIEILGILVPRLNNKKDVLKSGSVMLITLTIIYLISLGLATGLAEIDSFRKNESPFVIALEKYNITFFPHIFTGGIIVAGFSTLAASLFAVTSMIVTLAEDGDAPKIFSKEGKLKIPPFALALTIGGIFSSVVLAFIIPDSVYEYITTAAGLMLLYNWFFILISFPRLMNVTIVDHAKRFVGMGLILLAISGTLLHTSSRPGFYVSIFFVGLVISVLFIMSVLQKRKDKTSRQF